MSANPVILNGFYILDHRVRAFIREKMLILTHLDTGSSISVGLTASCLLAPLYAGATFKELIFIVKLRYPNAVHVESELRDALDPMITSGLIIPVEEVRNTPGVFYLGSIDNGAKFIAHWLEKIHFHLRHFIYSFIVMMSIMAVFLVYKHGLIPSLSDTVLNFSLSGFWLFVLISMPLHEFAHAIACRRVGIASGKFGIVMHCGIFPGPFIDTSLRHLVRGKWRRASIPLAGPIMNLFCGGFVALILILTNAEILNPLAIHISTASLHTFFLLCMTFLYFDTSPFFASDGSYVVEALMEDEYLRNAAINVRKNNTTSPQAKTAYRLICMFHFLIGIVFFGAWLF